MLHIVNLCEILIVIYCIKFNFKITSQKPTKGKKSNTLKRNILQSLRGNFIIRESQAEERKQNYCLQ